VSLSRRDLIDPESRVPLDALLEVMPGGFNAIPDIVARRATVQQIFAMLSVVENPDVVKEDRAVPGPDGDPDITVRIYRPVNASDALLIMPIYPMIDDTNTTASSHEITDVGIWDRAGNVEAWQWYLGGKPADQYAAPTRAADVSGLPSTYIDVGTVDLFRDEDIAFAQRLMQAGVACELHVNPGSYHGSETFAPDAALSRRIWATRMAALRRALT
jgi:acetyl esterase/lipase